MTEAFSYLFRTEYRTTTGALRLAYLDVVSDTLGNATKEAMLQAKAKRGVRRVDFVMHIGTPLLMPRGE